MENKIWAILRPNYTSSKKLKNIGICGSGFFIKKNIFVSAYHSLNETSFNPNKEYNNENIFIMNPQGKSIEIKKENIYKKIPNIDIILIKINQKEDPFEIEKNYSEDEKVKNIGYPERLIKEIFDTKEMKIKKQFEIKGQILEINNNYSIFANDVKIKNRKTITLNYSSERGFSGGPLLKNEKVIGIMSHLNPKTKNAVAISIDEVEKEINKKTKKLLEIKNLHVEVEEKEILKGVNLSLDLGKINALMGKNGSGKSTLVNTIMGHPNYTITKGKILFNKKDITNLQPNEKAKLGIFLSFQYPREIDGVTYSKFLRAAYNNLHENKLNIIKFKKLLKEKMELLGISKEMQHRYLNKGFSGGEKKIMEILQMAVFNPKLIILDETDSGLDVDAMKSVAKGVNKTFDKNKSIFLITHYKRILEYIKPDKVFIMDRGKIVQEGDASLVDKLENKGYDWING